MNDRGCYCETMHQDPRFMRRHRIPPGYCGLCRECGQPGHSRHSPIPAPFTLAWCDECYNALGNAYDLWIAEHPGGYTTEFMDEWRRTHHGPIPRRIGLVERIARLFRR